MRFRILPATQTTFLMPLPSHSAAMAGSALASIQRGVYATNFGGGQVDITSGKFVFSACTGSSAMCPADVITRVPSAERCNGIDDDCNGGVDEPFQDTKQTPPPKIQVRAFPATNV